jgi:hypothetical protein
VLFQDTAGKTYLAPEFEANADQAVLEAKPIRSLTLDSLVSDTFAGLGGNRETWDFAVCFVTGTRLLGPGGPVRVESLKPGDLVLTKDNGPMPRALGRGRDSRRDGRKRAGAHLGGGAWRGAAAP